MFHTRRYLDVLQLAPIIAMLHCPALGDAHIDARMRRAMQQVGYPADDREDGIAFLDRFGLTDDCPLEPWVWNYARAIVGATLTGVAFLKGSGGGEEPVDHVAECDSQLVAESDSQLRDSQLQPGANDSQPSEPQPSEPQPLEPQPSEPQPRVHSRPQRVALCWSGGRHHAFPAAASGYCYVNDAAIAVLQMERDHGRVLYVDIDVHHADGVERGLAPSDTLMTISFHKRAPGFFPGTGDVSDDPLAVNVPLRHGASDATFLAAFRPVVAAARDRFAPRCVVVQCGADALAGDPLGGFNLTPQALATCTAELADWGLPTLVLGGGGYSAPATSIAWCEVTARLLVKDTADDARAPRPQQQQQQQQQQHNQLRSCLPVNVPDSSPFFEAFAAHSFSTSFPPIVNLRDENTTEGLAETIRSVVDVIHTLEAPPADDDDGEESDAEIGGDVGDDDSNDDDDDDNDNGDDDAIDNSNVKSSFSSNNNHGSRKRANIDPPHHARIHAARRRIHTTPQQPGGSVFDFGS
jgi:acetoin utilization deacetylase AcuC-like enzyme